VAVVAFEIMKNYWQILIRKIINITFYMSRSPEGSRSVVMALNFDLGILKFLLADMTALRLEKSSLIFWGQGHLRVLPHFFYAFPGKFIESKNKFNHAVFTDRTPKFILGMVICAYKIKTSRVRDMLGSCVSTSSHREHSKSA